MRLHNFSTSRRWVWREFRHDIVNLQWHIHIISIACISVLVRPVDYLLIVVIESHLTVNAGRLYPILSKMLITGSHTYSTKIH
jgi:hypothetical protein